MKLHDATVQLEAFLVKSLLTSSRAFSGDSQVAGSSLTHGMFTDALAEAVARADGLKLASTIEAAVAPSAGVELTLTSGFGVRRDPFTGQLRRHEGVDLAAPEGTPFAAADDGVVVSAGPRGGYGNAVELLHGDGSRTLYGHAEAILVSPGDHVSRGQAIGLIGQTGRSTGPHLHLELRRDGRAVDPQSILKTYRLRAEDESGGES